MITLIPLALALAVGSVTASPIPNPQIQDPDPTMVTTSSPTVIVDPTPPTPPCESSYTSVAGDTCASIGSKYGLTEAQILAANTFLTCSDIWPYTPICVPAHIGPTSTSVSTSATPAATCAFTYTAARGDTCASIGAPYGLSADQILAANTFLNCADVWEWTPVCIPPGGHGPTSTATLPVSTSTLPPPTTTSANPACASVYTAQQGDTCTSIAKGSRSAARAVYLSNPTLDCNNIPAGTSVCLSQETVSYIETATPVAEPTPGQCASTYTSVGGDTCASIASGHDLGAQDIQNANSFVNCSDIWAGTSICIPTYTSIPYCKHIIHATAGESCYNLSRPYKIGGSDLVAVNAGLDCGSDEFGNSNATDGQEICIPWSTFY